MKNLQKTEIYKSFTENREEFKPYGLTFEKWKPASMPRYDRHNEIEINYIPQGSIIYMIKDRPVEIPSGRIALFWGLIPHKIIDFKETDFYYVCTIPLSVFINWKLPEGMSERLLKGDVLIDNGDWSSIDPYLFETWYKDLNEDGNRNAAMMEINGRIMRLNCRNLNPTGNDSISINSSQKQHIEKMSLYIAKNFTRGIHTRDVSEYLGLHPDYANALFRKAFRCTIGEYIKLEKITEAQRRLIMTDVSITDIAYDCGFNSISSFNCAFREINGCTPREFRKQAWCINQDC